MALRVARRLVSLVLTCLLAWLLFSGHPVRAALADGATPLAKGAAAWLATDAPAALLPLLSCLGALLSCVFCVILWRRIDSGQEAAKASMYAAGKLFDTAARRFARAQDEAAGAMEAASSAAGQAGQAAARLAASVRDTEARLSSCVGEGEGRLHAAAGLLARYDGAASGLPAMLAGALDNAASRVVPAIEAAAARLQDDARGLSDLLAETVAAAEARGATALQEAAQALQSRAGLFTQAAGALPAVEAALDEAATSLAEAQARQAALVGRVEALAGVLPSIATSLASTAAGQRQLFSQGKLGVEAGIQALRQAGSSLSASVDEAASLMRKRHDVAPAPQAAAAPPLHPALRPGDLRHAGKGAVHS